MKTFLAVLSTVLVLLSAVATLFSWFSTINPAAPLLGWPTRIGSLVVFVISFSYVIARAIAPEPVPDFLAKLAKPRIGRGNVLFVFDCVVREGIAWLDIHYQNRYANPAVVVVAIVPSQGFLSARKSIDPIGIQFPCGKAAYGIIHVPLALDAELQGEKQSFDVASQTEYPLGYGGILRNVVGPEMSKLDRSLIGTYSMEILTVQRAGNFSSSVFPTRIKLLMPKGVASSRDNLPQPFQEELWALTEEPERK